eukprot:Phypoly_transcript_01082.p1 GENE.Phypoly_transcript_01082~~Phypoly_transcript_01082.p1  ORF type:complete len:1032 (+),score=114.94 Phypoly_transcript_01082:178-3273(+)
MIPRSNGASSNKQTLQAGLVSLDKQSHQGHLELVLKDLFSANTQLNVRKDANLVNPITQQPLEVDIWLPDFDLYFEFQDNYHYMTTWYSHLPLTEIKGRDGLKSDMIRQRGAELIFVPCWWDGSHKSLAATILFERPDLAPQIEEFMQRLVLIRTSHVRAEEEEEEENEVSLSDDPITFNPSFKYFSVGFVQDVGELMQASFPSTTASFLLNSSNPWWLGEKYDGVRCCWNQINQTVYTRPGSVLPLHHKLIESLVPINVFLDCEFWLGRGTFAEAQTILSTSTETNSAFARMIAFDKPDPSTHLEQFEKRYAMVLSHISYAHPLVIPGMRLLCTTTRTLNELLETVIGNNGEGIILRMPKSIYEHGRSSLIWKVKAAKADSEALVVRAEKNMPVILQLPTGTHFEVAQPLEQGIVLKRGDVVTFTYDLMKFGLPVNPVIYRTRSDISWEDVVRDSSNLKPPPEVNKGSKGKEWSTTKTRWFFENFARGKNKDPLLPATWQNLANEFMQLKEARQILDPLSKRNYVKTVMKLFPEIIAKDSKLFSVLPYNYWEPVPRRRKLFIQLAKHRGFDPLIPKNWYEFPRDSVLSSQHAKSILTAYYSLDLAEALLHLFPEIGLDKSRLTMIPGSHWYNKVYQRNLLVKFASVKGFDPLVPKHWYSLDVTSLPAPISTLIGLYRNSFKRVLIELFPSIGLDKSKFAFQKRNYWDHIGNRRAYLERFAELRGFDPLIADNWCKITAEELLNHKYSASILGFYEKNYVKALQHLFPEVHFDEANFSRMPRGYWTNPARHRELLVDYARKHGFDPLLPEKWYNANMESLYSFKGIRSVVPYYGGSMKKTLLDVFPDIGFNKSKFGKFDKYWADVENQMRFFKQYAAQHGFDPLVPENWYSANLDDLANQKGARSIMVYYGASCIKALAHIFPNIDPAKFHKKLPNRHWKDIKNQRNWFVAFANAQPFDPLIANNWYSVSHPQIMAVKGARSMLAYYGNSYSNALLSLFPNIGLEKKKFSRSHGKKNSSATETTTKKETVM